MCVVMFGLLALAQFLCLVWQRAKRATLTCASILRLRKPSTQIHPDVNTAKDIIENLRKLNLAGNYILQLMRALRPFLVHKTHVSHLVGYCRFWAEEIHCSWKSSCWKTKASTKFDTRGKYQECSVQLAISQSDHWRSLNSVARFSALNVSFQSVFTFKF